MKFKERFKEYSSLNDNNDEWFYSNFEDEIINKISPQEAFGLIPEVVEFILEQTDDCLCFKMLQLILSLARKSGTTESPKGLIDSMGTIYGKLDTSSEYVNSKLNELRNWYRI